MSPSEELLTEEQSAKLAGVSAGTIRRFQEFGLLSYADSQTKVFHKKDILSLFRGQKEFTTQASAQGVAQQAVNAPIVQESAVQVASSESVTPTSPTPPVNFTVIQGGIQENTSEHLRSDTEAVHHIGTSTSTVGGEPPVNETETQAQIQPDPVSASTSNVSATTSSSTLPSVPHTPNPEIYEVNKLLREQIQSLKDERDWLKERLEKLEALSEREHMLLFSNSETIRQLLAGQQPQKKGFWASALPFFKK